MFFPDSDLHDEEVSQLPASASSSAAGASSTDPNSKESHATATHRKTSDKLLPDPKSKESHATATKTASDQLPDPTKSKESHATATEKLTAGEIVSINYS